MDNAGYLTGFGGVTGLVRTDGPMTITLAQFASRHDPIGPVIRGTYRAARPFERGKGWHHEQGLGLPPSQMGSYPTEANLLLQFVDCC